MREYEVVYIANPELGESQFAELNNRIQTMVEKQGGRFFFARNMGKRRLAYAIDKRTKGVYFCVDFASDGVVVPEMERMFRLNEDVMRFLTVLKSEKVDVEARAAEIAARGEDKPVQETTPEPEKPAEEKAEKTAQSTEVVVEEKVEVEVEVKTEEKTEDSAEEKSEEK